MFRNVLTSFVFVLHPEEIKRDALKILSFLRRENPSFCDKKKGFSL